MTSIAMTGWMTHSWGDNEIDIIDGDGNGVCSLSVYYDGDGRQLSDDAELEAKANLIAAAPDLKAALVQIMEAYATHLGVPVEACDKGAFAQAWSAIHKAEGKA